MSYKQAMLLESMFVTSRGKRNNTYESNFQDIREFTLCKSMCKCLLYYNFSFSSKQRSYWKRKDKCRGFFTPICLIFLKNFCFFSNENENSIIKDIKSNANYRNQDKHATKNAKNAKRTKQNIMLHDPGL